MMKTFALVSCLIMTVACCATAQVKYAPANLDDSAFIGELERRKLFDLVEHLLERGDVENETSKKRLQVTVSIGKYEEGIQSPDRETRARAMGSLDEALQQMKDLISSSPTHMERPVWQTDWSERVMEKWMRAPGEAGSASAFYDFGVPNDAQRALIDDYVADAYVFLDQADAGFRKTEDKMLADEDFRKEMEFSGNASRLLEEYWRGRTPYFLAQMAYYTALLPDDHLYWKTLGSGQVRMQKANAADERKRLLNEVSSRLTRMMSENANLASAVKDRANSLIGRAYMRSGKYDEAVRHFDAVIQRGREDYVDLVAKMGKAWTLHHRKQTLAAVAQLDRLSNHQVVVADGGIVFRLLITDLSHRIRMAAADKQKGDKQRIAREQAFQPYFDMLADLRKRDNVTDNQVRGLEQLIYRRWESLYGDTKLADMPAAVVLGIGISARQEGGILISDAFKARQAGEEARAGQLTFQAKPMLERAIEVLDKLLTRTDLIDSVTAKAMYNLGTARHFLHYGDSQKELAAAKLLANCAMNYPRESDSEDAIKVAVEIAVRYKQMPQEIGGADAAMNQALKVLFKSYPDSDYADDMRLIYGRDVLAPEGKLSDAVDILSNVPFDHPTYFDASRDALYILEMLIDQTDVPADRSRLIETMRSMAERLTGEGLRASSSASPADIKRILEARYSGDIQRQVAAENLPAAAAASAYEAAATGLIMQAHAAARRGAPDEGITLLEGFAEKFSASPEQISMAMAKRMEVYSDANRPEDAAAEAERMLNKFPDSAISDISMVLDKLETSIEILRDKAAKTQIIGDAARLKSEAQTKAKAAARMAQGLADRAVVMNLPDDMIRRFKLQVIKTKRIAGELDDALKMARAQHKEHPRDADISFELMETLWAYGKEDPKSRRKELGEGYQLIEALITTYDEKDANGQYPKRYWIAWLRLFEIMDAVQHNTDDIPIRVRNLRERRDSNLGGEPYRSKFKRLENKYDR